ncbi:MAG: zeta toxin family protein [Bacteroidota bacterium]
MKKTLEIIGGPNGSGKTTFAETALLKRKNALYINSDSIARGLTLNGSKYAQYEAGRFMLKKIDDCLKNNLSFSFETTMSGKIWSSHIRQAKRQGYKVILYFIFVNSIHLSLTRIKNRVRHGGHDISAEVVKRRFKRTFSNFIKLYAPMADEWYVIDNSKHGIEIAHRKNNIEKVFNKKGFEKYFL